jgi:DNA polymerase delta subunit 3
MTICSNIVCLPITYTEAKQGFDGSASQHVYSVQSCLPKDPAQLFSTEYVQAQELFMQPRDVDNCLRDNR